MKRRGFLTASVATAAFGAANAAQVSPPGETGVPVPGPRLPLGPLEDTRYPDGHIEAVDKKYFGTTFPGFAGTTGVERVATGFRWAEGPAYFRAGRYLLFSDIPNNRIMRLLEDDNHLSVFRSPSMNSNGNTVDRQGRLLTCEHSGRRVTRTELDGTITIIADNYEGKKLNSPNDLVVASDGSIWFTDPNYGIGGNYEGVQAAEEQAKHNVFRVDGQSGEIKVVVDDFTQPNGIALSPDEKKLYVIDSGITNGGPAHIRVFDVDIGSGKVSNGKVFAEGFAPGFTDGMRLDTKGNVWCSMGWADPKEDGVRCYNAGGDLLGKIHLPETCANLTFGGLLHNRLYMCASTSVYAVYVPAQGAMVP
ncbi:MAG: SMP-30/gluconolactonase/LRE family protein [Acetobacteraceae bacterium]|nr:SMP-30/gluconolactonase/LRE family protein [Acetobacteraceae bacterium]